VSLHSTVPVFLRNEEAIVFLFATTTIWSTMMLNIYNTINVKSDTCRCLSSFYTYDFGWVHIYWISLLASNSTGYSWINIFRLLCD
jgi:hypothetical protein